MDLQPEKQEQTEEPNKQLAAPAPTPTAQTLDIVVDDGPLAYIMDSARFKHTGRLAATMAGASLIPDHLRRNKHGEFSPEQIKCNCFRVVNQALRWGVDPWSIVDDTYVVAGKLTYQGKVIAGLINTKAPLKQRLKDSYTGTKGKDDYTIHISGTFIGENEPRTVSLSVGEARTENQMWKTDPTQKLWYSGVVRWARKYTPELVMGVFTDDDAERMQEWRAAAAKEVKAAGPVRTEQPDFAPPAPPAELPKKAKAKTVEPDPDVDVSGGKTLVEVFAEEKEKKARKVPMQPHEHLKKTPKPEDDQLPWEDVEKEANGPAPQEGE